MTDRPPIVVRGLSKVYRTYASPWQRLREAFGGGPRHETFAALDGIDFDLAPGESLGIIGENGAGKSTLLKILAGVVAPTAGTFEVHGKVASILELGSGFHPEFTGRQNILLNAAMLGLSEEEARRRLPDIIAFSELGRFIDQPVKNYSTGMGMRLGFSIATQVEPDVLIIDEALSVGDGYFQKKCMDRLLAIERLGTTLLFCSHAMYYVSAFCDRALWLRDGKAAALGPAEEVVRRYENFLMEKDRRAVEAREEADEEKEEEDRPSGQPARLIEVRLAGGDSYRSGDPWSVEIEWESDDPGLAFHLGVSINRVDELQVSTFATKLDGLDPFSGRSRYRAKLTVPSLPIVKGRFMLYVFLADEEGLHIYDRRVLRELFEVASEGYGLALVRFEHAWEEVAAEPVVAAEPAATA